MKYSETQLDNWRKYESVREQGMFNMFDPRAMSLTTMSKDEWVFCMEHYIGLKQEAMKMDVEASKDAFHKWEMENDIILSDDDRIIWMQGYLWAKQKEK